MLILDIEASGVNYDKHSIVSIGALDFDNPTNQFYAECRVWDGAHLDPEGLEVCGFTEEQVTDLNKMSEAELVRNFTDWSKDFADRTLTGQNVSFDRDMLRAATGRAGYDWNFAHRTIDTHTLCWMHMIKAGLPPPIDEEHKRSALNLDAVLNYCGIPEEPQPHNALTGALCHAEIVSRLLHNKKLLPEFEQYEIPWL
ncbi:3'-5' exonuclease [Candidatus Nomurabacteria bacterium]|nr:3'-5' exonuclease [Candidatus Nomurabacteria bacterium]